MSSLMIKYGDWWTSKRDFVLKGKFFDWPYKTISNQETSIKLSCISTSHKLDFYEGLSLGAYQIFCIDINLKLMIKRTLKLRNVSLFLKISFWIMN